MDSKLYRTLMLQFLTATKTSTKDYCTLEAGIGTSIVSKDGSFLSIVSVQGQTQTCSNDEYLNSLQLFAGDIESLWRSSGYQMMVVFIRDNQEEPIIKQIEASKLAACQAYGLDYEDVIKETSDVMRRTTMYERCFIALWTRPSLILPIERKMHSEDVKQRIIETKAESMPYGQTTLGMNESLLSKHQSFVATAVKAMQKMKLSVNLLDLNEAFRAIRNVANPMIRNEVLEPHLLTNANPHDDDGGASLTGDEPIDLRIGWRSKEGSFAAMLPKSLNEQIMVFPAEEGQGKKTLHDETMVKVGGITYAPLALSMPPKTNPAPFFNQLFANLAGSDEQGSLPYSIAISLESDGINGTEIKQALAKILAIASPQNKLIADKNKALLEYATLNPGKVIRLRISAMTWHQCQELADIRELTLRKMRLWRGLEAWGSAQVVENNGDAVEAWASSCLALSHKNIGAPCPMPFMAAAKLLPLTRPASPFPNGSVLYKSLDGKILPYSLFAPNQNSWITFFSGNMGAGKSVTLSYRVLELTMHSLKSCGALPYALIVDIGETSFGCAQNIRERLHENIRHLISFKRWQNTPNDSVNPLDTSYSFRTPHARDRLFMQAFVTDLVTSAERNGEPIEGMSSYVGTVIEAAFKICSDQNPKGNPEQYRLGLDQQIDEAIEKIEFSLPIGKSVDCWKLFDLFHEAGMYREAELIQRYAVPTLNHLVSAAQLPEVTENYKTKMIDGEPIFNVFQRGIAEAIKEFPAFSNRTSFDAGSSRLLFLDLNDVAPKGESPQVKKQASLFYMIARQLFIKKVGFSDNDYPIIDAKYLAYYRALIAELEVVPKGMFFDEVHRPMGTRGFPIMVEGDARESRKWQLMMDFYSQDMRDFGRMLNFGTGFIFMEKGSQEMRAWSQVNIGLSDTDVATMAQHCNGAGPKGAPYFAKFKTESGEYTCLMVARIGPKLMWSLSSNANDRGLRKRLIEEFGRGKAIEILATEFPSGNCKRALQELSDNKNSGENQGQSHIEKIAKRIITKYNRGAVE